MNSTHDNGSFWFDSQAPAASAWPHIGRSNTRQDIKRHAARLGWQQRARAEPEPMRRLGVKVLEFFGQRAVMTEFKTGKRPRVCGTVLITSSVERT